MPPGDDEALMEAVYSRGTVAISLDAAQPSFRFYASGARGRPPHQLRLPPRPQRPETAPLTRSQWLACTTAAWELDAHG